MKIKYLSQDEEDKQIYVEEDETETTKISAIVSKVHMYEPETDDGQFFIRVWRNLTR